MIDISIKALEKEISNEKKAIDFMRRHVTAFEKIDGTKLTLIRNDSPFDQSDYTKNWIVAYKGNVIYPTEFGGLHGRDEEVKARSIGTSQYKFVHDHIRKVHGGTGGIPRNTEFFVEFVQNKPTITRDYARKHGMYLVGFGPTQFVIDRGQLYSTGKMSSDEELLDEYRSILQLGSFPVVFNGNFSSRESVLEGCVDPSLTRLMEKNIEKIDFSQPLYVVHGIIDVFSKLESSLGGPAEGVVLRVQGKEVGEDKLYKVLASDQHDKEVRKSKASRHKGSEAEEALYWDEINDVVDELLSDLTTNDPEDALDELSGRVYGMKETPVHHPVKTKVNIQDDIMLTAKLRLLSTGSNKFTKLAVIPMAAKPYHKGHDELVRQAVGDGNETVILFIAKGGREELSTDDMLPLWRDHYVPGIKRAYGDNVIFRFSDSPMRDAMLIASDVAKRNDVTVSLYGDEQDAEQRVNSIVEKQPQLKEKIVPASVSRSETGGISGTLMRNYLTSGDRQSFIEGLPDWMGVKERLAVWKKLSMKFEKR